MLSRKCLLLGSSPFNKLFSSSGGLCKKGSCTFSFWQHIENFTSPERFVYQHALHTRE